MLREKSINVVVCNYCEKEVEDDTIVYYDKNKPNFSLCSDCVEKIIKVWKEKR